MKTYIKALIIGMAVGAMVACGSNKTAQDSDHDSVLSGSLNTPDSTKNDTLSNTGATNQADPSPDSTRPATPKN